MDILEKSKEYAKGKAIDAITAAIEQAYADGYKDGLEHYENERLDSIVDGIEYKDLDLPTGTRWASCYVGGFLHEEMLCYEEAKKLSLPTKADFVELCKECRIDKHNVNIRITGTNSKELILPFVNVEHVTDDKKGDSIAFWLRDDSDDVDKNYARVLPSGEVIVSKNFMGYKMPVVLVLRKEKA